MPEPLYCLEIDGKQEFDWLLRSLRVDGSDQPNAHHKKIRTRIAPRLGPSLIEQAPRSASTNILSSINGSATLRRTGPAPHGRGVARLLSDCHAAAVEAREGEAVEGFAEGSALVPQHADSHFLAERH
jgi:hypothetical protein